MFAAFRIVFEVVAFRLRKLEMANGVAAASIAIALQLPWDELFYRLLFAGGLNALVYLNNDYIDVRIDLEASDKDASKSRYLAEHMGAALGAQWGLGLLLAVAAVFLDMGLLVPLIAGGGICIWYSWKLKQQPGWDIVAMMIWGVTMPLCGAPADSLLGMCMALQLGLFSGVFESIQVMRDADEDALQGVRTTGVVLGKPRTLMLARVLMVSVSVYAALVMHPIAALVSLAALVVPFDDAAIERYWTRVKMVYGIAWLAICAFVYLHQQSDGLWLSIPRSAPLFG